MRRIIYNLFLIAVFALVSPDIVYATTDVTSINQRHYRWRDDTGDETSTGASFLELQNTEHSGQAKNTTVRLRVEIDNTGTASTGNQTYDVLQYSTDAGGNCNTGNWTPIPLSATTEHWQITTSQLTDRGVTTDHGFSTHQNSTFVAGKQVENPVGGGNYNVNVANTEYTHMEYALIATSNATDGQTYYIRPIRGGTTALANYVQCATITLETPPTPATPANLTQVAYRWFANQNATDVGGAGGYNTPTIAPEAGTPIRLRLLFDVGGGDDLTSTTSRLQIGEKPGGGCSSASFADLDGTTAFTWADNSTPSDGAALTANSQDPRYAATSTSHAVINQTYNESNNFTSSQGTVDAGASMLFDFALSVSTTSLDTVAKGGKTFCFQAVQEGGGSFAQEGGGGYTVYPELSIEKPEILRLRGHVRLRNVRLR